MRYVPEDPSRNWPQHYERPEWNRVAAGFGSLAALFSAFGIIGMIITRIRDKAR